MSVSMNKPELSHAVDVEGKEIKASFSVDQFLLHCRCFINNRFLQTKHKNLDESVRCSWVEKRQETEDLAILFFDTSSLSGKSLYLGESGTLVSWYEDGVCMSKDVYNCVRLRESNK